jgi:hypothetical protein
VISDAESAPTIDICRELGYRTAGVLAAGAGIFSAAGHEKADALWEFGLQHVFRGDTRRTGL